ncbi:hypothetical protein CERSUDRAFT_47802 [Gelatoporia subvermispora B]|uniref:CHCH domain-containing protein n=1 Tax=Ceriporiopsis subvermispora (strain B) TaxID=914234 RepID=M2R2T0_CERS8|nr:hypothetical protein CERSUDRAFT_47802 [Gelatoporia subvermispora B]
MAIRKDSLPEASQAPLPDPLDVAKPQDYRQHFTKERVVTKFVDPCTEASKASMACMDRNDYDRDKCMDFFRAYRDCKKEWLEQRKTDRRAGHEVH